MLRSKNLVIGLLICLLAACTSAPVATPEPITPLKIGWYLWPGWYPHWIAEKQGMFAEHNIPVETTSYDIYLDMLPDFASGSIDGMYVGLYEALSVNNISPVTVVLVTDHSDGAEGLVVKEGINSVEDLRGKTIGLKSNSIGEFFVLTVLQQHGMTVDDVRIVDIDPEKVPENLPTTIDAGYTWEPYISELTAQGSSLLVSTADLPGLIPDTLVFRSQVVEERPEDVQNFVNAWFQAMSYWQNNPDEGNAIIAEAIGLTPEEISLAGVRLVSLEENHQGALTPGDEPFSLYYTGQLQIEFLIRTGGIATRPDVNEIINPSFIQP